MNTPDAGRIRVRWYKVARPEGGTVLPLEPYSSSDWDEDPKSFDPEEGEESSSRRPFLDRRDCSEPPWDCPEKWPLPLFPDMAAFNYQSDIDVSGLPPEFAFLGGVWKFQRYPPLSWAASMPLDGPHYLRGSFGVVDGSGLRFDMNVFDAFGNQVRISGGNDSLAYETDGFTMVLGLTWNFTVQATVTWRFYAVGCNPILAESGKKLLTEDGLRIVTEG